MISFLKLNVTDFFFLFLHHSEHKNLWVAIGKENGIVIKAIVRISKISLKRQLHSGLTRVEKSQTMSNGYQKGLLLWLKSTVGTMSIVTDFIQSSERQIISCRIGVTLAALTHSFSSSKDNNPLVGNVMYYGSIE